MIETNITSANNIISDTFKRTIVANVYADEQGINEKGLFSQILFSIPKFTEYLNFVSFDGHLALYQKRYNDIPSSKVDTFSVVVDVEKNTLFMRNSIDSGFYDQGLRSYLQACEGFKLQ